MIELVRHYLDADGVEDLHILWQDAERMLCRGRRRDAGGEPASVLLLAPVAEHPAPAALDRLAHEYGLKDLLDEAWAARPIELVREGGRAMLVLEDPGGEPLEQLLGAPMETGQFLRLAIDIASALGQAHQHGLVHKDVKPANLLVNCADGARLTGFGVASRLQRERQRPELPEIIAGTLAYMAPEQTGRMNRSIDSRSDLYALGMTFYRMLTGVLPFAAADPMEWIHSHIARKPTPPAERSPAIPPLLSDIVMKLLAKPAEERYQSAAGLERDLTRCLDAWARLGRIDPFPLGERDVPGRLVIPEKLYGREREVEALLAAFDRVVGGGQPELVLVSGYSGIGKSSVVNELQKALVSARGQLASGKFDQLKRDVPYATLAQASQGLLRPLLGMSEAELTSWRDGLREALGPNGGLIADLVPEIALIIGEQPPAPRVEPQQAKARFQLVLRRFVGMFAKPEHPLVLFLDDLQWLDTATLDFIEDVLIRSDLGHLLLIGAYRDNEVDAAHPLTRKLAAIREAGGRVSEITLGPLAAAHVRQLIADALGSTLEDAAPLTQLVQTKTAGNPFFVLQFLHALADEGLLVLDPKSQRWSSDLVRIRDKGYANNVVDLMVSKLARLSIDTREALGWLACLGAAADVATLALLLEASEDEVHALLWEAVRLELIERLPGVYRFVHDRVQEAAYSLIPEHERSAAHLRIGRLLVAQTPTVKQEESIFDIVGQLNRGAALIASQVEREQLAELNLIAGKRAKASAAYASALAYFAAGRAQLAVDCWERRHELVFALELHRAECEFLTGVLAEAEQRLAALSQRAANTVERAAVACLRIDLYEALGESDRAVGIGLEYLRPFGVDCLVHPTEDEARREFGRLRSNLESRTIEEFVGQPLMTDPDSLATLDVLTRCAGTASLADMNLSVMLICRAIDLSLERGVSDGSCFAFAWLGLVACARFGDFGAGFQFGQLGYELVERRGLTRFQARAYINFGVLTGWTRRFSSARDLLLRAFDAANRTGDLMVAAWTCFLYTATLLAAGDSLVEAQREAEQGLAFARKVGFGLAADLVATQLALVRTLRGLTHKFGSFDDGCFGEEQLERRFFSNPNLGRAECWYWVRKLQALFFAGDYPGAVDASLKARRLGISTTDFEVAEYEFYSALSRAASFDLASSDCRASHFEALADHHRKLDAWAGSCPENFGAWAALVGAEIARIVGRPLDAMELYEQAIRSARANGLVHNEALAYELAARFHAGRGYDDFAFLYLRNARHGYLRWGADGKVRQLDEMYPQLRQGERPPDPTSTIGAPIDQLDLATVIKVSQAVSSEIVLEKLIDTLIRTAVEQAGAERCLLALAKASELRIVAEATTAGDAILVQLRDEAVTADAAPESMLHYVQRTRESVILADAAASSSFAADPYVSQHRARSVLCLPLINQAKLIGALYLENNLATGVFAPARLAVLKLLASQAAISLENAQLYRELAEREEKIRRLVDANIVGIFMYDFDGRILEANNAFLRIVGYEREDLASGRLKWTELTPPDWLKRDAEWIEEHKRTGLRAPIEKEYFRKDGSRAPVLLAAASFEGRENQGVAFVLDLTERKRAEVALRDSEEQWKAVFENNPTMYFMVDSNLTILSVNPFGAEQLGYSPEELIGRPVRTLIHEADIDEALRNKADCLKHLGRTASWESRKVRKDGSVIWGRETGRAMLIKDRPVVLIASEDITEVKRASEALRRTETRLRRLFEADIIGVFFWNLDGRILDANDAFLHIVGYRQEDLLSGRLNWREMTPPEWVEPREKLWLPELARTGAVRPYEKEYIRKDGGRVRVLVGEAKFETGDDDGVAFVLDLTERQRVQEALREMQAQLTHANRLETMGQLTASIAHEVNQPIAATVTNAQAALRFLRFAPPDLNEVGQALDRIVRDGTRGAAVVQRIRNLVKRATPRDDRIEINVAIREVIELTGSEAAKNGVSVRTELADGLPPVRGDRVELQQVVLNLIVNAVEAMAGLSEGERHLQVATSRTEAGHVLVAVRDTGPGLTPAIRENLFKAFHTTKPNGLGLGLSICRSIIESHGGRLWASSTASRGAVFQFTVPSNAGEAPL